MADLAGFLTNLTLVTDAVSTMVTSTFSIFMEPPLIVFVGLGIFITVAHLVKGLLR